MPPDQALQRKVAACVRCRQRKVKCDGVLPACSNCAKAGVTCEESPGSEKRYILQLEARIRELEAAQHQAQQQHQQHAPSPALAHVPPSPRPAPDQFGPSPQQPSPHVAATPSTPRIGPDQPLAHEVGLLSLQAAHSPKYLGPSSGVAFARLVFASAPHTQGLSVARAHDLPADHPPDEPCPAALPSVPEIHRFVAAYFDSFQHLYPFLDEAHVDHVVDKCTGHNQPPASSPSDADLAVLFVVVALGSRALETQLSADFASSAYLAAAMEHLQRVHLHESLQGVQMMLLLVLASFCFPSGLNAWYLTHTILASCLDLGLQRKQPPGEDLRPYAASGAHYAEHNVRSALFWSAYSLDRTLCTTLGRPLTLRDEAIDIEFPGQRGSEEVDLDAIEASTQAVQRQAAPSPSEPPPDSRAEPPAKRLCTESLVNSHFASNMSFRFDRIVAEIKLMIHRVAQSPKRFPWPTNFEEWRRDVHGSCKGLLEHARRTLSPRAGGMARLLSHRVLPSIELKHHQCVMLLFRPSPAFPRPSGEALSICFDSSTQIIRIYYELHRFGQMMNSWLTAHGIFVSAITMLYCLWVSPTIRDQARDTFDEDARRCSEMLEALGRTWSVAKDAQSKFDRLADATRESWRRRCEADEAAFQPAFSQNMDGSQQMHPSEAAGDGWTDQNADALFGTTDVITDQLGDMSGWFDLEWFERFGVDGLGNGVAL